MAEADVSSVCGAEEGDEGGSAGKEEVGTGKMSEEALRDRQQLKKDTREDDSLVVARRLADEGKEGYEWKNGLLYKRQRDTQDTEIRRLCLPDAVRKRCLTLVHDQFGHRGYKKVAQDLSRLFYRPSLWKDVRVHGQ